MGQDTLGEVRDGSRDHEEVRDRSGDHAGGSERVGGPSGRSRTGRVPLEEVREGSGGATRRSGTGRGTLPVVPDGSGDPPKCLDGPGDPLGGPGRVGGPTRRSMLVEKHCRRSGSSQGSLREYRDG